VIAAIVNDVAETTVDACTLNNVLNTAQLLGIVLVLRLLRRELVR
jgi:hypothetical protein